MESHLTSKICFRDIAGGKIDSPSEWAPALIELSLPVEEWEAATLTLNSHTVPIRLAKLSDKVCVLADWPLSNPGHFSLHLHWSEGEEKRTISILPSKISSASFDRLLLDLESDLPSAISIALQEMGALSGVAILPPGDSLLSQELVKLHRAIHGTSERAGLAAILEDLSERPHEILHAEQVWVKSEFARRPHPARLKDAICRGYNHTDNGSLRSVLDTRVRHTYDVYENRLLKTFVAQVIQRIRAVKRYSTRKNLSPDIDEQLSQFDSCLSKANRRAKFLEHVSLPRQLPARTTMVLLNRPPYRSAFQGLLEFNKSLAPRINEPKLESPIKNLPYLYQLWGTLMVTQVLLDVGKELGFQVHLQKLVRRESGNLFVRVMPDGKPTIILRHPKSFSEVRLIPERSYSSTGTLRSISFSQRPDIAIEIRSPDRQTAIILFDPKYKLRSEQVSLEEEDESEQSPQPGTPKKVDIDKMHSYRDAIRDSELRRVVQYAAILYPGKECRYADDIEALHANPLSSSHLTARVREVLMEALCQEPI